MSELLDKKMPVRKRRRAFAWWWTAAMWLLPLVGAGVWWIATQAQLAREQSPDTQETAASASIAATTPDPKPLASHSVSPAEVPENQAPQSAASEPFVPAEPTKPAQQETKDRARSVFPKTAPEQQAIPTHWQGTELLVSEKTTERTDAADQLSTDELTLLTIGTLTLATLPTRFQLLENKANAHNLLPATPIKRAKAATTKPKKKPQSRQLRVGATLGIATERFQVANSLLAGASLDWQPLRRWGLRSGLMYEYYRPSGFARPIAEINADEYADATRNYAFLFNNGVYVPGTSEALGLDVALPVTMMQRLRIPMLAYWQPAQWLRLYGGSSFSYTLRAHTSSKGLAFDSELVGARSPSSLAKVNKLATQELPRFQAQLQTGLGIRLGKRWEVEMAYRQSAKIQFKSLFDKRLEDGQTVNAMNTNRKPNHQFFTLGGIYFF